VEEFHSALRMVTVLLIINTSTAKHVAFVDHSGNGLLDVFQVNFLFTKLTVENSMHLKTDTSVTVSQP